MMSKYTVGDRIITPNGKLGDVSSVHPKIVITWENGLSGEYTLKQLKAWNYKKFLEDEEAIAECYNLTSAQESALAFASQVCNSDLNLLEPQRLTPTAQTSSANDIQAYTTTVMCEKFPDVQSIGLVQSLKSTETAKTSTLRTICTPIESTSLQPVPLVPHSPQKANDLEQQMKETVSPPFLKSSENCNPNSPPSKTLQDCSPAPTDQIQNISIFHTYSDSLPWAGTMRNGLLSEVATLPAPTLESEYCWLRSPGALSSTGKGRPPGQTKQEAELKRLGLINKGEVLNPAILCQWYEIPESWLDPSECRAATELLEVSEQQQEIFSILDLQRSPSGEYSTSIPCVEERTQQSIDVSCPSCESPLITLNDGCGTCGWIPENFLEETKPQPEVVQKPKGRQRKGCLYRYIENKKLKNGTIASYPRVIGHRQPDNPTHWRWGFNWEEKIDGEWKGRSIGSVPVGAIPLIEDMRSRNIPLQEIIDFIKRSKNKK
jgi:hypothetical protein